MMRMRLTFPLDPFLSGLSSRCLLAVILTILLTQCGGGETKTGSNGTGVAPPPEELFAASGPITSLGPTGIGGTSMDDSSALLQINAQLPRPIAETRLGMITEASGTIATNASTGTARTLNAQSAVIAPVTGIDLAARRLTVLSVSVQVDQNTILEGFSSLERIGIGTRVEVYGLPQPTSNAISATRIIALPVAAGAPVEILGRATGLTSSQFNLPGIVVTTNGAVLIVAGIAASPAPPIPSIGENARVRVIGTFDAASNTLNATQIIGGLNPVRNDDTVLALDGLVQSVSAAGRFRVNDTDVDATVAGAGMLVPGARVQVRGRKLAGVLVASEFRLIGAGDQVVYTVQGAVSDLVSAASFKVRGEAIDASAATFTATPGVLANGRQVRVKAVAGPGHLTATEVTFLP